MVINNLRMRINEILDEVDPSGFHISEDSRTYLKDAITKIVVEESKNAWGAGYEECEKEHGI